mmetsp:Transcript_30338/g.76603  ORF Transcript_30338/g.76603 Transcript_30338/m.76603 type:complete len:241 (+) Transcript_30338:84-806(+)
MRQLRRGVPRDQQVSRNVSRASLRQHVGMEVGVTASVRSVGLPVLVALNGRPLLHARGLQPGDPDRDDHDVRDDEHHGEPALPSGREEDLAHETQAGLFQALPWFRGARLLCRAAGVRARVLAEHRGGAAVAHLAAQGAQVRLQQHHRDDRSLHSLVAVYLRGLRAVFLLLEDLASRADGCRCGPWPRRVAETQLQQVRLMPARDLLGQHGHVRCCRDARDGVPRALIAGFGYRGFWPKI